MLLLYKPLNPQPVTFHCNEQKNFFFFFNVDTSKEYYYLPNPLSKQTPKRANKLKLSIPTK